MSTSSESFAPDPYTPTNGSTSYRVDFCLVADIRHMLDTFPDMVLNGSQDFTDIDGDFFRLVITNNEINLLEGHLVYT